MIDRPVLRYHGGKFRLAPWIISHFPPHRTYVEPYGGAASVLLTKPRSVAEVYNDAWGDVVNVFSVLRDPVQARELERLLRVTPYAREEFDAAARISAAPPIERARQMIVRSFAGFASASSKPDYQTGFRANSNRSNTSAAQDWANYPDHIRRFTERLRGVVIEHRDAARIIEQQDGPDTLHYVDPPYPQQTRKFCARNQNYAHEMSQGDHVRLAELLNSCTGMVAISSYPNELYDRLFVGWMRDERLSQTNSRERQLEVLYLNAACVKAQRQQRLIA
jgi:DNA adenine methylase